MSKVKGKEEYDAFVQSLNDKSKEELEALEKEIISTADALDKRLTDLELPLSEDQRPEAIAAIKRLLNKQTINWQYTLGAVNLYHAWDDEKMDKVKYPVLDATLCTLGEMQFTGISEWEDVILVNAFFESLREQYVEERSAIYLVAEKHNALLQKLELFKPHEAVEEGTEDKEE